MGFYCYCECVIKNYCCWSGKEKHSEYLPYLYVDELTASKVCNFQHKISQEYKGSSKPNCVQNTLFMCVGVQIGKISLTDLFASLD